MALPTPTLPPLHTSRSSSAPVRGRCCYSRGRKCRCTAAGLRLFKCPENHTVDLFVYSRGRGGPLLDGSSHLVGIVTAKLNAALVARFTGDIPQNVNFALKAEVVRTFLESRGIAYQSAHSDKQLSPADVGDIARAFTVSVECEPTNAQSAALASPSPSTLGPNTSKPTAQEVFWCKGDSALRGLP
jgi:hypothetical protein